MESEIRLRPGKGDRVEVHIWGDIWVPASVWNCDGTGLDVETEDGAYHSVDVEAEGDHWRWPSAERLS